MQGMVRFYDQKTRRVINIPEIELTSESKKSRSRVSKERSGLLPQQNYPRSNQISRQNGPCLKPISQASMSFRQKLCMMFGIGPLLNKISQATMRLK